MKPRLSDPVKRLANRLLTPTPRHLAKNQIQIDDRGRQAIEESLQKHYYTGWRSATTYSDEMFRHDLNVHLQGALERHRRTVVPWLDSAGPLVSKRILEVGSGTGSSTVALAEQGAKVIGIDLNEGALSVARDRSGIYGLEADFRALNAVELSNVFGDAAFDLIIFFACLEHMTIGERLSSLGQAWELLPVGGLMVIVGAPNRLWYADNHTSMLPFFHWLPNDLAFHYSRFSPRQNFRELYTEYTPTAEQEFLRRGRGLSFHEVDLAIRPVRDLKVVSSLSTYLGIRYKIRKSLLERRYKRVLKAIYPDIHEGFLDDTLHLILEKD